MGSIVIGSGYRGLRFVRILSEMGETVSAVVENNRDKHSFIRWQLKEAGCGDLRMFSDYREAFDTVPKSEADRVFIITPDFTHREIFEECVKRKYHIFLEKPIATKRNDIADMVAMSENYEKIIQVGFVLRYTPFYSKIKEIVSQGLLGKIALIQMNERLSLSKGLGLKKSWHNKWENTGGFFNEKCSHDIDLMLWMKQSEAKAVSIYSYGSTKFGCEPKNHSQKCSECSIADCPYREKEDPILNNYLSLFPTEREKFRGVIETGDRCFFHTYSEVYDNQSALIVFSDGSHGTFSYITISGDPGRDILIHGTEGSLSGNFDKGYLKYYIYNTGETKEFSFDISEKHGGGDEKIIKKFLDDTKNGASDGDIIGEGAIASVVAFQGDYSMYTGKCEPIPNLNTKGDFVPFEEYMRKNRNMFYNV